MKHLDMSMGSRSELGRVKQGPGKGCIAIDQELCWGWLVCLVVAVVCPRNIYGNILFACVLLLFYVLATFKVTPGQVLTCDSVHSWWLYNDATLRDQVTKIMTLYPAHWHYPDTVSTIPCHILLMPKTRLGSNKCWFYKSWFDSVGIRSPNLPHGKKLRSTNSGTRCVGQMSRTCVSRFGRSG